MVLYQKSSDNKYYNKKTCLEEMVVLPGKLYFC